MICRGCGNKNAVKTVSNGESEICDSKTCGDLGLGSSRQRKSGFMYQGHLLKNNRSLNKKLAKGVRSDYLGDNSDEVIIGGK